MTRYLLGTNPAYTDGLFSELHAAAESHEAYH